MRFTLLIVVLVVGLFAAGCLTQKAEGQKSPPMVETSSPQARVPVVVELFTSEGCSSCPPADRTLKFLAEQQPAANAEIIPLAFHVDYWDNQGWKDKFSSATFTRRQELYVARFGLDSSYTPEMVVDGKAEFIGSDTGKAVKKISEAANEKKGRVTLSVAGDVLNVSVSDLPEHHPSTVYLALTENGLMSEVKGGENSGQTFDHSSVVRSLTTLGLIEKDTNSLEIKGSVPAVSDVKRENSQYVVFVQDNTNRKILGVALFKPQV